MIGVGAARSSEYSCAARLVGSEAVPLSNLDALRLAAAHPASHTTGAVALLKRWSNSMASWNIAHGRQALNHPMTLLASRRGALRRGDPAHQ